ncbi:MAG: hypothetical protein IPO67_28760 [Deltaproteobacteria bacterium]|nr:hypothetical protein [Deltaproteobacteria bacterium]
MTQTTVSKTFAFATQNGEYWQEFVAQQPEFRPDEVTPDEEESIRAAREHVRDAVLDLLEAVMAEVHTRAGTDPWLETLTTSRRRTTMESHFTLSLPLIKAASLEASVVFIVEVGGSRGQTTREALPGDLAAEPEGTRPHGCGAGGGPCPRDLRAVRLCRGRRRGARRGGRSERIATQAVDAVWDLALAFRERVQPRPVVTT